MKAALYICRLEESALKTGHRDTNVNDKNGRNMYRAGPLKEQRLTHGMGSKSNHTYVLRWTLGKGSHVRRACVLDPWKEQLDLHRLRAEPLKKGSGKYWYAVPSKIEHWRIGVGWVWSLSGGRVAGKIPGAMALEPKCPQDATTTKQASVLTS